MRLALRSAARAIVPALALSLAGSPVAESLHARRHVVRPTPLAYEAHDDAAHHAHRAADHRPECALCTHSKSPQDLQPTLPPAMHAAPSAWIGPAPLLLPAPADVDPLRAPRAPPVSSS